MKIEDKIRLILDTELLSYEQNGRRHGGLGSFNVSLQSVPNKGWTIEGATKQYLFSNPDQDFIKSENAKLLMKLYSKLGEKSKSEFENRLLEVVNKSNPYHQVGYLICFFFIRIGKLVKIVETSAQNLKGDSKNSYSNLLHIINLVVSREYPYFSLSTYDSVIEILKDDDEAKSALLPTLKAASKKIIARELEDDGNEEILNDMVNVTNFFHVHYVEYNIPNQIKHINDLFDQGVFDGTTYATCIDRVRVLISSVVKIFAIEKSKTTSKILDSAKDDKVYLKYLYDNHYITKEEYKLLVSFYSLCSNKGAHISSSTKEVARLVKNMGIELVVLMRNYIEE